MNRQQKETVVSDFKRQFDSSQGTFLVDYKGLTVASLESLRTSLREKGGRLQVAKARLMKRAVEGIDGVDQFRDALSGQVAMVFAESEVPTVAKELMAFSKDHELLKVLTGFFESRVLSEQDISVLASLPSREVLLGQLAGTLQAPISGLAQVLSQLIVRLAYVLQRVAEKKE